MRDKRFCVVIASLLTLITFVLVMRFLPDFIDWAGWPACEEKSCTIQGWLSATSGWAGFAAASVTAFFIFGQMKEARTQTRFALGDAVPTVQMAENVKEPQIVQIRIVNWNRRQLILDRIEVLNPLNATISAITFSYDRKAVPWSRPDPDNLLIKPAVSLQGWENRGLQPPYLKIACKVHAPSNPLKVRLHCRQISEETKKLSLTASCDLSSGI
ncbi:hypothetical protein ELH48_09185 [Rhizobium ruizarguesonis]|uniref:hypothetical protein n=1 Tax=Rhizobium ruizarguesonis TaxID=2081791 RepID=UPI001031DC9E|nr:hypothetical protein [Rhizobium ruizarguesonis]TBB27312.1 hypothetical protein ELH48_09185 [Rhizobium ruizarguesonis]